MRVPITHPDQELPLVTWRMPRAGAMLLMSVRNPLTSSRAPVRRRGRTDLPSGTITSASQHLRCDHEQQAGGHQKRRTDEREREAAPPAEWSPICRAGMRAEVPGAKQQ